MLITLCSKLKGLLYGVDIYVVKEALAELRTIEQRVDRNTRERLQEIKERHDMRRESRTPAIQYGRR